MTVFESPVFWQSVLCFLGGFAFSYFCATLFGAARDLVGAMNVAS